MKNLSNKILLLSMVAFIFASCSKIDADDIYQDIDWDESEAIPTQQLRDQQTIGIIASYVSEAISTAHCDKNTEEYDLLNTQGKDIGKVVITNDEEYVYVKVFVRSGYDMLSTAVYLGEQRPTQVYCQMFANYTTFTGSTDQYCYAFAIVDSDDSDMVVDEDCDGLQVSVFTDVVRGGVNYESAWIDGEALSETADATSVYYEIIKYDDPNNPK